MGGNEVFSTVRLTEPRRRALAVVVEATARGRSARISNVTDATTRVVYWQTARWLIQHGLARTTTGLPGCQQLRPTEAGRILNERGP